ncbi:unnamed protein product [Psylliodes chrysocephalus]|uniref:Regulation of nuclear pre-mRNA domain-containing protein 2 n=1 Tax=Psylliodes chrysocephalus TaxID=3402493 RepID=A0A9P0GFJ0_9CUCU|nr:unnamed protein product [Psylliodes chrysocephala]
MGTKKESNGDFNVLQFEKQLLNLKDSQEAINNCCQWCLQNRVHHKKIVNSWLNILKRVKVEQRLVLFYLANDVVQYSKRRNFDFVESWGTALQKATTMVRDEKVKHKIFRIFKIWEQRGVYNEEFISDLCGLLSVLPSAPKNDEPHEFQPNYVINKIKTCTKLETDTDIKLKLLKEHNPKIQLDDGLIMSLKDRAHVDDVEKEIEVYIKHMEDYINALKLEIKNRITVISVLKQAETQLEADRKDVKVVANAYKMFGTRVKTFQRKLEEHKQTLSSPVPSPDINAPSPSPDSDIDLPEEPINNDVLAVVKEVPTADYNPKAELQYNSGYYTPIVNDTSTDGGNTFLSANGFSSFMGSETFNLETFNSSLFSNISSFTNSNESAAESYTPPKVATQNPPLPVEAPSPQPSYGYGSSHVPLLPPPMPPFSKSDDDFGNSGSYEASYTTHMESTVPLGNSYTTSSYEANANYAPSNDNFGEDFEPPLGANPYPPSEEYNPEDDVTTWEPDASWNGVPPVVPPDTEDSMSSSMGAKDVDHRNLISLTGSPGHSNSQNSVSDSLWNQTDQDYRIPPQNVPPPNLTTPPIATMDQDYRLGFNIDQLKLPPPPPPPPKFQEERERVNNPAPPASPDHMDMDMSDEENRQHKHDNLRVIIDGNRNEDQSQFMLEPPPPLPELPEDADANNFLDDLSNELNDFDKDDDNTPLLLPPPPMMNFNSLVGPPLMPHMNTSVPPPPPLQHPPLQHPPLQHPPLQHPPLQHQPLQHQPLQHPPLQHPPLQHPHLQHPHLQHPPLQHAPLQPPPMMPGMSLGPSHNPWLNEDDQDLVNNESLNEDRQWMDDNYSEMDHPQDNWMGPPPPMPPLDFGGFRGRGNNRGNFVKRGRGRGGNFRGNFRGNRGNRGGNRGFFPRGNYRGNFQRGGM